MFGLIFYRATLRGKAAGNLENTVVYPPNGVIPFHGFAMFCAPFCYVYDDPEQLYLGKFTIISVSLIVTCSRKTSKIFPKSNKLDFFQSSISKMRNTERFFTV